MDVLAADVVGEAVVGAAVEVVDPELVDFTDVVAEDGDEDAELLEAEFPVHALTAWGMGQQQLQND